MGERDTYFIYKDGFTPSLLQLGNLVFDYENPRTRRPYVEGSWNDERAQKWTTKSERTNVAFIYEAGKGWNMGGGIETLANLNFAGSNKRYVVVLGQEAEKQELIEPEEYFEEVVLKSEKSRIWLTSRLSVTSRLAEVRKISFQPIIWFVTGRFVLKQAQVWSFTQAASAASGKVTLIDPTGTTSLAGLSPEGHFQIGSGILQATGGTYKDAHIWAAQYQGLDARFRTVLAGEQYPLEKIRLINKWSAQRGSNEIADFTLGGVLTQASRDGDEDKRLPDEYWTELDAEVQDLEEELLSD